VVVAFQMVKMAATLPSFVGVAWALGAYNRTVRFSLPEKANAGWKHVIMTTVARLLLICKSANCNNFVFMNTYLLMNFVPMKNSTQTRFSRMIPHELLLIMSDLVKLY
jgi:hypothetical protein